MHGTSSYSTEIGTAMRPQGASRTHLSPQTVGAASQLSLTSATGRASGSDAAADARRAVPDVRSR